MISELQKLNNSRVFQKVNFKIFLQPLRINDLRIIKLSHSRVFQEVNFKKLLQPWWINDLRITKLSHSTMFQKVNFKTFLKRQNYNWSILSVILHISEQYFRTIFQNIGISNVNGSQMLVFPIPTEHLETLGKSIHLKNRSWINLRISKIGSFYSVSEGQFKILS